MPNTLAHLGVQAVASRALIAGADLKWIYLAAVIPDLPWILQRIVGAAISDFPLYDLRLYAIVQSSLFMCCILSVALAGFSARPRRVFVILALGSLLHLVLDALQTKWGNGVHLFAPFSWELLNFGLFWPEDIPTLLLTAFGLGVFFYGWWRIPGCADDLVWPKGGMLALGGLSLLVYVALPVALLSGPRAADNHSVATLRDTAARPGKTVAFDRNTYDPADGGILYTLTGERLELEGVTLDRRGSVSARGRFLSEQRVRITDLHQHHAWARDLANYVGLGLVALYWMWILRRAFAGRVKGSARA